MVTRWFRVFKAVRRLMHVVANADEDSKITPQEARDIMKATWVVVGGPTEGSKGALRVS